MSYLLDTCVVSETTKPRPAATVLAWLKTADPVSLHVCVITLGEIEKGIERLPVSRQQGRLRRWAEQLRSEWQGGILDVDEAAAIEWGRILARAERRGEQLPVIDALIGATAVVHGLAVVTRNSSDIGRTGAAIFDPWSQV